MDHLRSVLFASAIRRLSIALAQASVLVGCLVLLGWILDLPLLKSLLPGFPNMAVSTAIGFVLAGMSIQGWAWGNAFGRSLCRVLALLLVWCGSIKILLGTTDLDLWLDQWIFPDTSPVHGSMVLLTAVNFSLIGAALLLLGLRWRRQVPSEWLAAAVFLLSTMALLGGIHDASIPFLMQPAIHTSFAFMLCSVAIILADPDHITFTVLSDGGDYGVIAHRLLPAAVFVPIFLGWMGLVAQGYGIFSAKFTMILEVLIVMIVSVSFSLWTIRFAKQSSVALNKEEERLRVTLRSIGDGVIAVDLEMRVTMVNAVAEKLTGWTHDEALGHPVQEVFHIGGTVEGDSVENPIMKALHDDTPYQVTDPFVLVTRSGGEYTVADNCAPIHDTNDRMIGAVLIFRDITDRLRADKELLKLQKLESLAVLAGGIAHDFNNILGVILANVSLAATETGKMQANCLSDAEAAVARGAQLSGQLMVFAKGSAAIRKSVTLGPIIEEAAKFALTGTNSCVAFDLGDEDVVAEIDPGQISQVLQNLVLNASQSMPSGGFIHIGMQSLEVAANDPLPLAPDCYHRIMVTDQGQGIVPEVLGRIFEPFFSTKLKGNGLGLASAYGIAKDHKGYLMVETVVGRGSTFSLYLPASTKKKTELSEKVGLAVSGRGRILIMDDDASIMKVSLRMLASLGYRAEGAMDGAYAIEMIKQAMREGDPYDVAILDLTIPGAMGGQEAIQKMLAIQPDLQAIVASGYSEDPVMEEHAKYGFAAAMLKPYSLHEMSQVVNGLIGNKAHP